MASKPSEEDEARFVANTEQAIKEIENTPDTTEQVFDFGIFQSKLDKKSAINLFKGKTKKEVVEALRADNPEMDDFTIMLLYRSSKIAKEGFGHFIHAMLKNVSLAMFLLMPIFAAVLALLYRRRKEFFYVDHLVFSVHFHSALFLFFSLIILLDKLVSHPLLELLYFILINLYLLFSLKTNYVQPWGKTIIKFILLTMAYGFILLLAMIVILMVSIFTL